jgi:hypothetical protein
MSEKARMVEVARGKIAIIRKVFVRFDGDLTDSEVDGLDDLLTEIEEIVKKLL